MHTNRLLIASLALPALFVSPTFAQTTFVHLEGVVSNVPESGFQTGPCLGVAEGDPFELTVALLTAEAVAETTGSIDHLIRNFNGRLFVGGRAQLAGRTSSVLTSNFGSGAVLGNDAPQAPLFPPTDFIYIGASLSGDEFVNVVIADDTSALLHSNRIEDLVGTYVLPETSFAYLASASTGCGIDVQLMTMEIAPRIELGTPFCPAPVMNSTGGFGRLEAVGSDSTEINSLLLSAGPLPDGQLTLLIASRQQGAPMPLVGSAGTLCLGSPGRFGQEVVASHGFGSVEYAVDLRTLPTPLGSVAAQPGDTWSFQAWYRDLDGSTPTSNLTDGVAITLR